MRRDAIALIPALLVLVVVVGPARAAGGFTQTSWGACTAILAAYALTVLVGREVRLGRLELIGLGGWLLLGVWTALSLLWSSSTPLTALGLEHALLPVAAVLAALCAVRPATAPLLAVGVFGSAFVIALLALLDGTDRALGYANAVGLVCVVGALLAGGWAVERRDAISLVALVPIGIFGVAAVQADSRGATLALLGGVATALALRLPRPAVATFGALAVGTAVIVGLALSNGRPRSSYWEATAAEVGREPLLGSGARTWSRVWLEHRDADFTAVNAHSLYLEVLSELGPLGLALLLVALLAPLAAAVRARRQPFVPAITAAYVAFLLHMAVDWVWQIDAAALTGLFLGAALLVSARGTTTPLRRLRALPAALAAATIAAAGAVVWAGGFYGTAAQESLRSADWTAAERDAIRAHWLQPWASEPWRLRGQAELAQGRKVEAAASFRRGLRLDPGDAELWRLLAGVSSGAELRHARDRVAQLDPRRELTT